VRIFRTSRILVTVVTALITIVAIAAVRAHDDSSSVAVPGYTVTMETQAELDSLFAIIHADYLPLKPMFEKSCFDCHSDQTEFPWYYELPGIKGIIKDHVKHGRAYLDLSNDFPFAGEDDILEILEEIRKEVEEGEMPLFSYRLMHWDRLIEGAQQDSLFNWIDQSTARMKELYQRHGIPTESEEEEVDEY